MFQKLEGSSGDVLGVKISQGYTKEDVATFIKAFEATLAQGYDRLNILVEVDELSVLKSEFKAFWRDGMYAATHLEHIRHVAIVGDSSVLKAIVAFDNAIMGDEKVNRIQKYFDIAELDSAWEFVRS